MIANIIKKYPVLILCLGIAATLLPNLEVIDVTIMEARNFITAREMLTDNNWLLTTMNGEARYEKPPLPTWLTAISAMLFGIKSVFVLRLPAVILIMVIVVYVYKISKEISNDTLFAFVSACIASTSFYIIGIIIEAPWDIFAHGFMCVAIYHLFLLFEKSNQIWKNTLIAGCFLGFSFLCKGPVSIYALMLPFLLAYGFTYKYSAFKSKIIPVISIIILMFFIGGWWYVYVRFQDPETFTAITQKETGNWSSYNVRPFYYYWSFFTQSGLWTIPAFISLLYPYLKSRVRNLKAYQFTLLWTLFAVILLSIIPEKKSRYLMPVLIPLAINCSFYIDYLIREFKNLKDKRETFPVYFNFGLIGTIGLLFPFLAYWFLQDNLDGYLLPFIISSISLFLIGFFIFRHLRKRNFKVVFYLSIGLFAIILITALPLKNAFTSPNFKPIHNLYNPDLKVYQFNYISPEMIWQYGHKIPDIKLENGTIKLPKESTFGLLTIGISPEDKEILQSKYNFKEVYKYDLNQLSKDSKQYKDRLTTNYYILTRK